MKIEYHKLIIDTLNHLKTEGYVLERLPKPLEPFIIEPASIPIKIENSSSIAPIKTSKKESSTFLDKIQKHLPHFRLIKETPQRKQVAILVFEEKDLPFLKNLAKAIHERFIPVKLIDGQKIDLEKKTWENFELILSNKEVNAPRKILLEPIEMYTKNPEMKKLLWSKICHFLSPKSS